MSGSGGVSGSGSGGVSGSGGASSIPGGGTVLFRENFADDNFTPRGWFDGPQGTISTAEHAPDSTSSYECAFAPSGTTCAAGKPARHEFTATETVYASFWLKFSANWVGSGRAYHPHMFHFINDLDNDFVGPARTLLDHVHRGRRAAERCSRSRTARTSI